jgi:hypothetical protein
MANFNIAVFSSVSQEVVNGVAEILSQHEINVIPLGLIGKQYTYKVYVKNLRTNLGRFFKFSHGTGIIGFKLNDFLHCLMMDYQADTSSLREFTREFGYDDITEARKIFRLLKKNKVKLDALFTKEEINNLILAYQEY